MKKALPILFFIMATVAPFVGSTYEYDCEIVLSDGSVHNYGGSTHGLDWDSNFGHDPSEIESRTMEIYPWEA